VLGKVSFKKKKKSLYIIRKKGAALRKPSQTNTKRRFIATMKNHANSVSSPKCCGVKSSFFSSFENGGRN